MQMIARYKVILFLTLGVSSWSTEEGRTDFTDEVARLTSRLKTAAQNKLNESPWKQKLVSCEEKTDEVLAWTCLTCLSKCHFFWQL